MLVSYSWLNKYFEGSLPSPETVAEALTFHAWEIESVDKVGNDTVLDIKVLPDKAMWGLSHRGIAKDISVILNQPLKSDPLLDKVELLPISEQVQISIESETCRRFAGALIKGVKVGPSPEWLKIALESIGQRSINNIVDASNYVMFDLGQPSHAFDADMIGEGILVRQASEGENLKALDESEYTFTTGDTLITRLDDKKPLSIAGIKGGIESGITSSTNDIFIEVANWDPISTRRSAARLKLRSDASSRYENGIVPEMVPYGLKAVVELILSVAGGELIGYGEINRSFTIMKPVSVSLSKINSVLGIALGVDDITEVINRFGWQYKVEGQDFVIIPPFERTDLNIAEDIIEEVGRIYGYQNVVAEVPKPIVQSEINQRFYYSEIIREALIEKGFSEVYTSSFRNEDKVKLANAFASDKGYLRGDLKTNLNEVMTKNAAYTDLLGIEQVKVFEIGTVFLQDGEKLLLSLGVQSPSGYKVKIDDPIINEAIKTLAGALQITISEVPQNGVLEINLGEILPKLPIVKSYRQSGPINSVTYKSFSPYPAIARDIAMWADESVSAGEIEDILNDKAGILRVRTTLFDEFRKNGRVSYAFRLVFQSNERTLTDNEVNSIMEDIYQTLKQRGFEVR